MAPEARPKVVRASRKTRKRGAPPGARQSARARTRRSSAMSRSTSHSRARAGTPIASPAPQAARREPTHGFEADGDRGSKSLRAVRGAERELDELLAVALDDRVRLGHPDGAQRGDARGHPKVEQQVRSCMAVEAEPVPTIPTAPPAIVATPGCAGQQRGARDQAERVDRRRSARGPDVTTLGPQPLHAGLCMPSQLRCRRSARRRCSTGRSPRRSRSTSSPPG